LFELLAQTSPTTRPYQMHYLLGSAILVGTLIAALLGLATGHRLLRRARLLLAFTVAMVAFALYFATLGYIGKHTFDFDDPVVFWATRLFAATMVFVGLQVLDRVLLVPLLTRRGKIALPRFIHQIVNILLALFAILIYGSIAFGWDIDRFLAGSAVVSIVLGLALQESLGNFFSGLVMQASPPFAIGHRITCGEYEGEVIDMTWRAVTLYLDDDNYVIIPNATVAKSDIVNFNVPSRATARFVRVGLDYELPPADAIAVLTAAALESQGVLHAPEPVIFLENFADSSVTYAIKFWIEDAGQHEIIEHRVRVHLWYRLRERGYSIPFPMRTVEHSSHAQKNRLLQESARTRRIEAIEGVPLLQPLSSQQKRELADSANELYLMSGQVLFRQNDSGDSFYIIFKGSVEVLVTPEGGTEERRVATLGPGDFFGEMSALTGQPRSATIRASAPLACVQIEKRDLLPIFQSDLSIMEKISQIVARRNAEREAVMQGAGAAPPPEAVTRQQKTLLGRMFSFFRLNAA
jgi:small-conductance mechanosensitive channel/CRP-like cAMP-binding protein